MRDLSAFRDGPTPRTVDVAPPPPPSERQAPKQPARTVPQPVLPLARPPRETSTTTGTPRPSEPDERAPRRKVMAAIAADLHRRLRAEADKRGVYKADIVLDGYMHHGDALRREHAASVQTGMPQRVRRRRAVVDATQCQLYLTDAERARIDDLAAEVGRSRSELVSRLVELELEQGSEASF